MLEPEDAQPQQLDSCGYQGGRVFCVQAAQEVVKLYVDLWVSGCPLIRRQVMPSCPSGRLARGINIDWCSQVSYHPLHVVEPGNKHHARYLRLSPGFMNESVKESCWCGFAAHQEVLSLAGAPHFPVLPGSQARPNSLCFCIGDPGNLQIHPSICLALFHGTPFPTQPSAAFPGECLVQGVLGCCPSSGVVVQWAFILP